jgi:hypothetical protein
MAYPVQKYQTYSQNYISRGIASNFYSRCTWLSLLGAMSLGNQKKDELEIGRPDSGEILSGANISPIERKNLGTINRYLARVQTFETSNTKWMGERDTLPTVANPTTASHGQANQAAMSFAWADVVTPILIWHEDMIRADDKASKEGVALARAQVIEEATEVAYQEHVNALNTGLWTGNPADQVADLWSAPLGLVQAFSASNVYGGVNRAVDTAVQAQVDATITSTNIRTILDNAQVTRGLRDKSNGIDLMLTTPALYLQFKAQITAASGTVMHSGLPAMAKMGVKKEVLMIDDVAIAYDLSVPANHVMCFNTKTWKVMFHPKRNLTVTPFVDLSKTGEGAKDADQAYIRTRLMQTCDDPSKNVVYTLIGT